MKCEIYMCTPNQSICIVSFFSLPLPRTSTSTSVVVALLLVLLGIYIVSCLVPRSNVDMKSRTHTVSLDTPAVISSLYPTPPSLPPSLSLLFFSNPTNQKARHARHVLQKRSAGGGGEEGGRYRWMMRTIAQKCTHSAVTVVVGVCVLLDNID